MRGAEPATPQWPIAHLSVSAISDWIECPLRFYGRRVAHWPEPPSVDLLMGKAMHAAFEAHHKGEDAELALIKGWADVTPLRPKPEAFMTSLRALGMYCKQNPVEDGDKAEQFFRLRMPGLPVPLIGYFDLVRRHELHEFKTGRARWGQKKVDAEMQATAYWWAFGQAYKGDPDRLVYHLITTNGGSAVYRLETRRTTNDVLDFFAIARRAWAEICRGELRRGCRDGRCCFPDQCAAYR